MDTSVPAFLKLSQAFHDPDCDSVQVTLGSKEISLETAKGAGGNSGRIGTVSNAGGSKKIYHIGNGMVLALLNVDSLSFEDAKTADTWLKTWRRMLGEEKDLSDRLKASGLMAVDIDIEEIEYADGKIPVSIMPHFETFVQRGIQVRDCKKSAASQGYSMLFGSQENIESRERLKMLMGQLKQDIVTLASNGYALRGDALNLAIVDTKDTPNHDRHENELFDKRNQKLRLFFFDLASHQSYRSMEKLKFLSERGEVSEKAVTDYVSHEIDRVFERLTFGIREDEIKTIIVQAEGKYNQYTLFDPLEENFNHIRSEIVEEIKNEVLDVIKSMSVEKRRELFSVVKPNRSNFVDRPKDGAERY